MSHEITDKLFVIYNESKKLNLNSTIKLSTHIEGLKSEAFSYESNTGKKYCEYPTIRDYIQYAIELKLLQENSQVTFDMNFDSIKGFNLKLGDLVNSYLQRGGVDIRGLSSVALELISSKKLPTTDNLYETFETEISQKYFKWSFLIVRLVDPVNLDICRKWLWVPKDTFSF